MQQAKKQTSRRVNKKKKRFIKQVACDLGPDDEVYVGLAAEHGWGTRGMAQTKENKEGDGSGISKLDG